MATKGPKNNISVKRRLLFSSLMLLIPLIFFALLELLLRVIGYGSDFPLVNKDRFFGKEKYVVNRQVAQRYFSLPKSLVPEASEEMFDVNKQPNRLRIFCLGGSTTAGFPYEINATFPFQLQFRLREELMGHWAEVVNLGISAVNSYTVLDLLPEVLELEPDALIIYMGHNEFYGAYGAGSTQFISNNRKLTLLYLKLKRLRFVQLLQNVISGIRGRVASSEKTDDVRSIMELMAGDQAIPLNSQTYKTAYQNYEANLIEIIQKARKKNVPVILSTLVCNLKDQKPFVSQFASSLDEVTKKRFSAKLLEGTALQAGENHQAAIDIFDQIIALDSTVADVYFHRATSHLSLGDSLAAYQDFSKARDLDQLRFRAPAVFNEIIRRVAKNQDIPLLDMEKVFRTASAGGIPGKSLFHEHLHPRFDGYRLMAQAFLEALRTVQIINPPAPIGWKKNLLSDAQIQDVIRSFRKHNAGVTPLDLEFGEYQMYFLIHRWPFKEMPVSVETYPPYHSETTKTLAIEHLRQGTYWDAAHYKMADHYIQQKQFSKAHKEFRAVYYAFHENPVPITKIADLYLTEENYTLAKTWYTKALKLTPESPHLISKMGSLYVFNNQFDKGVENLVKVLAIDSTLSNFSDDQKANFFYLLGVSYANLKKWPQAYKTLDQALAVKPGFPPAQQLKVDIGNHLSKATKDIH